MAGNGTDHGQSFSLGGKPPASSSVKNHFDIALTREGNESLRQDGSDSDVRPVNNPNQGEQMNLTLNTGMNKFPRQHGSDSLTEEEAQLS